MEQIKEFRISLKLTVQDFADIIEVSKSLLRPSGAKAEKTEFIAPILKPEYIEIFTFCFLSTSKLYSYFTHPHKNNEKHAKTTIKILFFIPLIPFFTTYFYIRENLCTIASFFDVGFPKNHFLKLRQR